MKVLDQYCETISRGLLATSPQPGWLLILALSATGFFGGLAAGILGALIQDEPAINLIMGPAWIGSILGVSSAGALVFSSSLWLRMAISAAMTLALSIPFGSLDFAFGLAWMSLGVALSHDFYTRLRHSWSWAWTAYPALALIFSAPLFFLFHDASGWFGSCVIGALQWFGMMFCKEAQLLCDSRLPWLS